ncbi:MAG: exodeoxyribonuclease VII small subunit [Candidatus Saccharibacteria bacterium]|jgi:exodeoxyribonuclease VII small subunit
MATKDKINYNQLQEELDGILSQLQEGRIDVDSAIIKYDRGQEIIKKLEDYLKNAENKINKINPVR